MVFGASVLGLEWAWVQKSSVYLPLICQGLSDDDQKQELEQASMVIWSNQVRGTTCLSIGSTNTLTQPMGIKENREQPVLIPTKWSRSLVLLFHHPIYLVGDCGQLTNPNCRRENTGPSIWFAHLVEELAVLLVFFFSFCGFFGV